MQIRACAITFLVVLLAVCTVERHAPRRSGSAANRSASSAPVGSKPSKPRVEALPSLPSGLAPVVLQTLQASSGSTYRPRHGSRVDHAGREKTLIEARNDAHRFTAAFLPSGVTLRTLDDPQPETGISNPATHHTQSETHDASSRRRRLELRLAGYGFGDSADPIGMEPWQTDGARVERTSGDPSRPLIEWYVNGRLGLEQGFTITSPPESSRVGSAGLKACATGDGDPTPDREANQELVVELAVGGEWTPRMIGDDTIAFVDAHGLAWLEYGHLYATDADGRALLGRMSVGGKRIVLRVAAAGASYPVTIDPITQQAQLTASDGASGDQLGVSVALSGDTAVVGASSDDVGANANQGSAYVFVRSGTTWSQQAKLTASDGASSDNFGISVAVSDDTAVVGAYLDDVASADAGSAYVFLRSGTTWSQQAKLTPSDNTTTGEFGISVAVSGDTAVIGHRFGDSSFVSSTGAAYVFVRSGTTWSQQKKLTAGGGATGAVWDKRSGEW